MTTETIDIRIREDGSRVVSRNIREIGEQATTTSSALRLLKAALAALAGVFVVDKIIKMADAWNSAAGSIRIATKSAAEATYVQEELFKASQKTGQGFSDMVTLYTRAARAGKSLGASQQELIKFTEDIGKALAIQGGSAESAKGALLQLGQALGSGIVRAEEFNSILEGAPYILQVVANNINGVGGNIAKLRKLMLDGKLSSREFFDAFKKGGGDIEKDFGKASETIAMSMTRINNALTKYVGELDAAMGVSKAFSVVAKAFAANIDEIGRAIGRLAILLGAAALAYGVFFAAQKVSLMVAAVKATLDYSRAVAAGTVVTLGSAKAELQRSTYAAAAAATAQAAAAAQVAAAAEVATAEAAAALAATRTGAIQATVAATKVTAQRQVVMATLAATQAEMVATRANIAAAEAAGAQSFAIAAKQAALTRLAAQEATYATQLALLGNLDRARVVTSEAQTVALTQQTAAQVALNTATAAGVSTSSAAAAASATAAAAQANAATAAGLTGASVFAQALDKVKTAAVAAFSAVGRLFVLINSNPFVAVATAIIAVTSLMFAFGDTVALAGTDFATLRDLVVVFGSDCLDVLKSVGGAVLDAFGGVLNFVGGIFSSLTGITREMIDSWFGWFDEFFAGTGDGFTGLLKKAARVFDSLGGIVLGFVYATKATFELLPKILGQVWSNIKNTAIDYIEGIVNLVISGMNKIASLVGLGTIDAIKFSRDELNDKVFTDYGAAASKAFAEGFESQGKYFENKVTGMIDRANERGKARLLAQPETKFPREEKGPADKAAVDEKALKKLQQLREAYLNLLGSVNPVAAAERELEKAQNLLNAAQAAGIIDANKNAEVMGKLRYSLQDQLDPLGAVNRELDQQTHLLGMNTKAREIEAQMISATEALRQKGKDLTDAETAALRAKLIALQELTAAQQAADALQASTQGQREAFGRDTDALQKANNGGIPGVGKGDVAMKVNDMAPDLFAGTQTQIDAHVKMYEDMYAKIEVLRGKDLISDNTAEIARARVAAMQTEERLKSTSEMFGNLASLSQSGNKRLASIGKAAAITQATIDGYVAINKALSNAPGWPYNAGQVIAVTAAQAVNVAKIAGFESGGYTGNGGTSTVAGVVHGKEFVVNAEGTARNRAVLESMNRGASVGAMGAEGAGGAKVTINVFNKAEGTTTRQEERDGPNGKEIDIIVERAMVSQVQKGGKFADAMESQYGLNRAVGTRR